MTRTNLTRSIAVVLAGATLGGAAGAGAVTVLGGDGSTTTVVRRQAAVAGSSSPSAVADTTGALTARQLYEQAAPSVVHITATTRASGSSSPFDPSGGSSSQATGSGFFVTKDGQIVTNAHVVDGATSITVKLASGQTRTASLVGKDDSTDVALLKISTSGLDVTPLRLADSSQVQVGDATAAIGNPYGLDRTLTTGVVSAVHRTIQAPNGFSIPNAIQTDAALNPGNSGGPLLDAGGAVIGINSQIYADNQGSAGQSSGQASNSGIGFAVPSSTVSRVVAQLRSGGKAEHAYLGVQLSADAARRAGGDGHERRGGGRRRRPQGRRHHRRRRHDRRRSRGPQRGRRRARARRAGAPDGAPRRLDPDADRHARHPPVLGRDGRMSAAAAPAAAGTAGALSPRDRRRAEALPPPAPGPHLAVLDDDGGIAVLPLADGTTTIGRALHAGLRLDDHTVSRRHAVVHRDGDEVVLADERSLNGVTVNGGPGRARRPARRGPHPPGARGAPLRRGAPVAPSMTGVLRLLAAATATATCGVAALAVAAPATGTDGPPAAARPARRGARGHAARQGPRADRRGAARRARCAPGPPRGRPPSTGRRTGSPSPSRCRRPTRTRRWPSSS